MSEPNNLPPQSPAPKKSTRSKGWLFILVALILIVIITFRDAFRSIDWETDYQTARQQAQKQEKPLLLVFDAPAQKDCQRMMDATYGNIKVIKYISANFVPVLLDFEKNKSLADKFQIDAPPIAVVVNPDTEKSATVPGYVIASEFNGRLRRAKTKTNKTD